MTTMTAPAFSLDEHPVGEITLFANQRPTDRVSALVGYRLEGIAGMISTVTRVDVVDFVAYDTAS
jgi:hypothetical protein